MSLRERRAADCESQVENGHEQIFNPMSQTKRTQVRHRGDRVHFPRVQALGNRSHKVPKWLQPFKEGLSGEPPDTHNVVVEKSVVEPKEKTPDDMRVSTEKESANLPCVAE